MKKLIISLAIIVPTFIFSAPKKNKSQRLQQDIANASMILQPQEEIEVKEETRSSEENQAATQSLESAQRQNSFHEVANQDEVTVLIPETQAQTAEYPHLQTNSQDQFKSPSPVTPNQDLATVQSSPQRKTSPRPSSPERPFHLKNSESSTGSSWDQDFDPKENDSSEQEKIKRKKYTVTKLTHQKSTVSTVIESLPDSIQQAAVAMFNPMSAEEAITKKYFENIQQIVEERSISLPDYLKSINPLDNGEDERQLSGAVHEAISQNHPVVSTLLFQMQEHHLFSLVTTPTQQKIKEHLETQQKLNKRSFKATMASFLESFNKNKITLDALSNNVLPEPKTILQSYEDISGKSKQTLHELTKFATQTASIEDKIK